MAVELTTKYLPYVDEIFAVESKSAVLTNKDFTFDGAHSVKIRKVSTSEMTDYGRTGPAEGNWSRFGSPADLNVTPETFTLSRDRSFSFVVDKLDENETDGALAPATALARQLREVVIPEVDCHTLTKIVAGAGTVQFKALSSTNIYNEIIAANKIVDDNDVPESGRVLVVTPDTLLKMKGNSTVVMATNAGSETVRNGVIGMLDGMTVLKVPASRLPAGFGFMIAHPVATVALKSWQITGYTPTRPASAVHSWKAGSFMTLSCWTTKSMQSSSTWRSLIPRLRNRPATRKQAATMKRAAAATTLISPPLTPV